MKNSTTINNFQRQAIKFGGFDILTVESTSQKTVNILTQYSLLLLIPMIVGGFSSGYAAYTISHNLTISLVVGSVWCGIIYLIDRAILSTNPSTSFGVNTIIRILLTVTLSTLFAEPLVLMIFKDSITESQHEELILSKKPLDQEYQATITSYDVKEANSAKRLADLQTAYTSEMDGTGGSGIRNQGPIYKQKYQDYLTAVAQHNSLIESLNDKRNVALSIYDSNVSQLKSVQATNLAGQFDTLHELKSPAIQSGVWVLRFALIFLELIPVLIKLKKSDSWDKYWEQVHQDNHEAITVYSNNSEYRIEALDKEAQIKHKRRMKQLDKEDVQADLDHQSDILDMQVEEIMNSALEKLKINAAALSNFAEAEKLRNQVIDEIEIAYADFRRKTSEIVNNQ